MRKERKTIPLVKLELNKGQIEWLPTNPRQWTKDDLDKMVASLDEDPDFMEDRPPLVTPQTDGKFCVFAGNERTEAEKRRKAVKGVECIVYTPEDDDDQMTIIRRAMKDNGHFGDYDWDILANEWSDFPLDDWGVKSWKGGEDENPPANPDAEPKNKPFVCKLTFVTASKMTSFIQKYKNILEDEFGCILSESGGEL